MKQYDYQLPAEATRDFSDFIDDLQFQTTLTLSKKATEESIYIDGKEFKAPGTSERDKLLGKPKALFIFIKSNLFGYSINAYGNLDNKAIKKNWEKSRKFRQPTKCPIKKFPWHCKPTVANNEES